MTSQRGTMSCVALREKKQKSMFIAEPVIKIEKKKLRNNRLFDARWYTNLQRLQGARPNHVRWETYKQHVMTIPPRVWEKSARSDCPSDCRICNNSSLPIFGLPFPWRSVFFRETATKIRHPGYRWYLFATSR